MPVTGGCESWRLLQAQRALTQTEDVCPFHAG